MKKSNAIKNFKWLFKSFWETDKKFILYSILTSIFDGIFPPLLLIIMQKIINSIQIKSSLKTILLYVVLYIGIEYSDTLYGNLVGIYNVKFKMKYELKISEKIYNKLSKLSLKSYENSSTYDFLDRAQYEGGNKIVEYFTKNMSIFTQSIMLLSYGLIIINLNSIILLIIIIISMAKYQINNVYNLKQFEIIRERTNDSRKTWYLNYILTYGNYYKELKTYNLFDYFISKYKKYISKFNKEDLELTRSKMFVFNILSFIEAIINVGLYIFFLSLALAGKILIGNTITYINSVISLKSTITNSLLLISETIKDSLFMDQIFEFFNLEEEINENKVIIEEINNIKIKNLSYKYPNTNKYVLKNINLEINKNEKIILLGQNGSGKTTLIKLIMGFYLDYEGEIFINEIELRNINTKALLSQISTLFQDFAKYEATIRENIGYSNLDILNNDSKIREAVYRFNLKEILEKNDNNIDTQLGNWFDNGINLSMGQWQKIAISRTFVKKSSLYILDEPNASMDLITEKEISKLYEELLENKIGVIIAHRFSNLIKVADKIIVLSEGEVVEEGIHEELYQLDGVYREMCYVE